MQGIVGIAIADQRHDAVEPAAGYTAARDAVLKALRILQRDGSSKNRRATATGKQVIRYLLAFSDGLDNHSITSVDELQQELRHTGVKDLYFTLIAAGLYGTDRWAANLTHTLQCDVIWVAPGLGPGASPSDMK